jgi:uncharacterized membrane protein
MTNIITDLTQQKAVTILRILYPIWAVVGIFSIMYVPATLIVAEDATTTANNILDNELLFRMGIVGSLITQLIFILVVLVLFKLFKQVNENHASLMVIFALVSVPIAMLNTLNRVAALLLLNGADYLQVFGADQLHAQMMLFLNLNEQGVFIASIFWGLWLFPLGYLIYKSGYFPRILGVLVIMAGFGYLIDFFTHFLLPNYETIGPVLEVMTVGETIFMAWVLLKGAKIPKINPEIT